MTQQGPRLRRIAIGLALIPLALAVAYGLWQPGKDMRDGRHDRRQNALWMAHGWLGADEWFIRNGKTNQYVKYRQPENLRRTADWLRQHHIKDLFPHLCPAAAEGGLPEVDARQVERFLDAFAGFRVLPWIGGPNGAPVNLAQASWRATFVGEARDLLARHPRLAGVQLNIEPLPDGDPNFLTLLEELRAALPKDKIISVAAYPPPTRWHPFPDLHWSEGYFRQVAPRSASPRPISV